MNCIVGSNKVKSALSVLYSVARTHRPSLDHMGGTVETSL